MFENDIYKNTIHIHTKACTTPVQRTTLIRILEKIPATRMGHVYKNAPAHDSGAVMAGLFPLAGTLSSSLTRVRIITMNSSKSIWPSPS